MTRDEILNMPAGKETDKLVAEHVMGLRLSVSERYIKSSILSKRPQPKQKVIETFAGGYHIKKYSTDIAAAWEVVEKIVELFGCDVSAENRADIHARTRVCICRVQYGKLEYDNPNLLLYVFGETIPLAICRAALLAVMELP